MNILDTRNPVWADAAHTMIDVEATPDNATWYPHTLAAGSDLFERYKAEAAPYVAPVLSPAARQFRIAALADQAIDAGYRGKRASLYGYLGQLNALTTLGSITADQKADLATLLAAAVWEQSVLDAAAAATDPASIVFPAPPAALATLADLS